MTSRLAGVATKEGVKEILSQAVDKPWSALKPLSVDVTRTTTLGLIVAGWSQYDVQTACAILSSFLVAKISDLKNVEGPLKELLHVAATSEHAWILFLSNVLKDLPTQQAINAKVDLEPFTSSLSNAAESLAISATKSLEQSSKSILPFQLKIEAEEASQSRVQEIRKRIAPAGPPVPMLRNNTGAIAMPRSNAVGGSLPRGSAPAASFSRGNTPTTPSGNSLFNTGRRPSAPTVTAQKSLFIQPSKARLVTGLYIKCPKLTSKPLSSPSMPLAAGSLKSLISPLSPDSSTKSSPSSGPQSLPSPNLPSSTFPSTTSSSSRSSYQFPSKVMTMSIEASAKLLQQTSHEAARIKQQQAEAILRERERKRGAAERAREGKEARKQEEEESKRRATELAVNKRKRELVRRGKEREQDPASASSVSHLGHGQLVTLSDLRASKRQRKDTESETTVAELPVKEESPEKRSEAGASVRIKPERAETSIKMESTETRSGIPESTNAASTLSSLQTSSPTLTLDLAPDLQQIITSATHLSEAERQFLRDLSSNSLAASERTGHREFLLSMTRYIDEQKQRMITERTVLQVDMVNRTWTRARRRHKGPL